MTTYECTYCGSQFQGRQRKPGITRFFCSRWCKDQESQESGKNLEAVTKSYYKTRYGLTVDEANEMRKSGCNICGANGSKDRWGQLHIDHNHKTGKVRGVLCTDCNVSLGKFHDDPELLRKSIKYLEAS